MDLIFLILFDTESEEHAKRLHLQRQSCGWASDSIESWRASQRAGKKRMYWVVPNPAYRDCAAQLSRHTTQYPLEITPLENTAVSSHEHEAEDLQSAGLRQFLPIGHIALDDSGDNAGPSGPLRTVTTFYISHAVQGGGFGSAAMKALEAVAQQPPICAKAIELRTIANSMERGDELYSYIGIPRPMSTEDWYRKRGYTVIKTEDEPFHKIDDVTTWPVKWVYMRKSLDRIA